MDSGHPVRSGSRVPRTPAETRRLRVQALAVVVAAAIAGAVLWGIAITRGGGEAADRGVVVPFGPERTRAVGVAVGGDTIWTIGLRDRRLRSFAADTLAAGASSRVGEKGDLVTAVVARGGAVWVALRRSGTGFVVRLDDEGGGRRVLSMGDLLPDRIAVTPARVVATGDDRVAAVPIGRAAAWSWPLPGAVNVAVGYGSVWALSRLPNARSLITRRAPGTGRVIGRRVATAGATGIAVGLGAVWVANGCANGVLRVPVGPGPGVCIGVGKGPSDVTVGAGSVWAADAAGGRIAELDASGSIIRSWQAPGRPWTVAADPAAVVALTRGGRPLRLQTGGAAPADPA